MIASDPTPPTAAGAPRRRRDLWLWALPNVVLVLFVAALFGLLAVLSQHEQENRRAALARDMQWAEQTVRRHLLANQEFLQQIARDLAEGGLDAARFGARVTAHVADNPELTHVVWVGADQAVRWAAPYETTTWNAGERLSQMEQTVALQRAGQTARAAYTAAMTSPDGLTTIEVHVPVLRERRFLGTIVGVYAASGLLRYLSESAGFPDKYRLVLETEDRVLASNSAVAGTGEVGDVIRLDPPGNGLRLRVVAFGAQSSAARDVLLLLVTGLAGLMAWSLWMLARHVRRRIRAERAVQSEVAFRQAMEESVMTGLRAIDMQGRIIYVNPAFCRIVGYSAAELTGRAPPFPYWPEERRAELYRVHQQMLAGALPRDGAEVRIRRKDGTEVDVRMYLSPLVDADGRQTGWMGSMIDITEHKRAEAENLRQEARLQQTSRLIAMGEMASSLAHELNQPLAAITNYCMGCVNRLKSGEFRREDLMAAMQKATSQAERAGKIIRYMRAFVKKSEPQRTSVAVSDIIEQAVGFAEIEAGKAGVRIEVDVPAELPPVFADKIMIEQVVLNLVKNGIEAMHDAPGGARVMRVAARRASAHSVELSVSDRGHGISAAELEKLFQPFYTTKEQGMGMGLNICRSIVEFHNGRLWAEAQPEGGSVFRFTLPVGAEA